MHAIGLKTRELQNWLKIKILLLHYCCFPHTHTPHDRSVTLANSDMLTTKCHTMEGPSMHSAAIAMNISWYRQLMAETRSQTWSHSATFPTIYRYDTLTINCIKGIHKC